LVEAAQRYRLCEKCIRRQGGNEADFVVVAFDECFICGGLMDRADSMVERIAAEAGKYEFKTFGIGLSMPEGVQEREDEIRSSLKLKGRETIKTELSKMLAAGVEREFGKRQDKLNPDLIATVGVASGEVAIRSRPLFFYGRYTKPRGIAQRKERCAHCSGRGCEACKMTGFKRSASVELGVGRRLVVETGAEAAKFAWIGSEDKDSKVVAPGRPFVAELKNPRRRKLPKAFLFKAGRRVVNVSHGRLLPSRPAALPRFRFRTLITAKSSGTVDALGLRELAKVFRNAEVVFDRPNERPVSRRVYRVTARARGRIITIDAELDGGLPVKRFVSGELVSPSVSEVLKTEVRCRTFDICGVRETGKFGFGEVSRIQARN
jgi:tRNA pseudouridine synthase 10